MDNSPNITTQLGKAAVVRGANGRGMTAVADWVTFTAPLAERFMP